MTFALIVSILWVSHQSTLGRPVTPAALNIWVGLTCDGGKEGYAMGAQGEIRYL